MTFRGFFAFFAVLFGIFLILNSLSVSVSSALTDSSSNNNALEQADTSIENPLETLKDTSEKVSESLSKNVSESLSKEIEIPENLRFISKILFGIESNEEIKLDAFLVYAALWVFLLLVIRNLLEFSAFFEGWKSWLGSITVTSIISITGALNPAANFFFGFGDIFGILNKWSPLKTAFALILIAVIFVALNIILRAFKDYFVIGKAYEEGLKAGAEIAKLKAMSEIEKV